MINRSPAIAIRFALAALVLGVCAAPAAAVDFKGKTVSLIVNLGPGSSTNISVRQLAPYISKHLPGKPTIVLDNKPGGRRTLAAAVLERTKRDGLNVGVLVGFINQYAIRKKINVKPEKLGIVGGLSGEAVLLARGGLGAKKIEDLRNLKRPAFLGSTSFTTGHMIRTRLFFAATGIPFDLVTGYRGQVALSQSMLSKEVDLATYNFNRYLASRKTFLEQGKIAGLVQFGELNDKGDVFASKKVNLETMDAAWRRLAPKSVGSPEYKTFKMIYLVQSVSRLYALPSGTSADIVKVWSTALRKAHFDPDYLALIRKQGQDDPQFSSPATVHKRIAEIIGSKKDPGIAKVFGQMRKKPKVRGKKK